MRVTNRLLAFILGAVLAIVTAAVAIDAIASAAGGNAIILPDQRWLARLLEARWTDPILLASAVGLVVVGAALLAAGLVPQRPQQLQLDGASDAPASIDRRGLQERLGHAALRDPDVIASSVHVRRVISVNATVATGADPAACRERVRHVIASAVEDVQLAKPRRTRVRVAPARRGVR